MSDFSELPYRPCAGIMLANRDGLIFTGQRIDNPDSEAWQMPQGGIDDGEDAEEAALRELEEETGVLRNLVTIKARSRKEFFYDLPEELIGKLWGGKWRGQRQVWFLMQFNGEDADVNIATKHAEFSRWQWSPAAALPDMIVPFKKRLYQDIIAEFSEFI